MRFLNWTVVLFVGMLLNSVVIRTGEAREVLVFLRDKSINESSGLDLSYQRDSAVWTHNDSGGKNRIYQVDLRTGDTVGTLEFKKSDNRDWEDIVTFQVDGIPYLMICDVGDNSKKRKDCQLCIVPEPVFEKPGDNIESDDWLNIEFAYEDGPRNCESVAVDVDRGKIFLLEKIYPEAEGTPGLYVLDLPETLNGPKQKLTAKRIGELSTKNLTAMDLSDDGLRLAVRNYPYAWVFTRKPEEPWADVLKTRQPARIELPLQPQGEGICFSADGDSILLSSENEKQPIWRIPIP